jgi:hypothetical protein
MGDATLVGLDVWQVVVFARGLAGVSQFFDLVVTFWWPRKISRKGAKKAK